MVIVPNRSVMAPPTRRAQMEIRLVMVKKMATLAMPFSSPNSTRNSALAKYTKPPKRLIRHTGNALKQIKRSMERSEKGTFSFLGAGAAARA